MTLLKRGEIDRYKIRDNSKNAPYYYRVTRNKKWTEQGYRHEFICSQLYTLFVGTGLVTRWERPQFKDLGLRPDRFMQYAGLNIYWEIDRGSETYDVIRDKIEKYLKLASRTDTKFHVIFVTRDYLINPLTGKPKQSAKSRATGIYEILHQYGFTTNQFLIAIYDWILKPPFPNVFVSAKAPQGLCLSELSGVSEAALTPALIQNPAVSEA